MSDTQPKTGDRQAVYFQVKANPQAYSLGRVDTDSLVPGLMLLAAASRSVVSEIAGTHAAFRKAFEPVLANYQQLLDALQTSADYRANLGAMLEQLVGSVTVDGWTPATHPADPGVDLVWYPSEADPARPESTEWHSDPRAASYTFALAFCIVFAVATRRILGPEPWHELRDDSAWVAAYTALLGSLVYLVWKAASRTDR